MNTACTCGECACPCEECQQARETRHRERNQTQEWLDKFQGLAADKAVEILRLKAALTEIADLASTRDKDGICPWVSAIEEAARDALAEALENEK